MRSDKVCQRGVVGCRSIEATSADLFVDSIVMETTVMRDNECGVVDAAANSSAHSFLVS